MPFVQALRWFCRVALGAFFRFNADDGWAIASHIALSALMALFPFLIVVTSLAAFLGSSNLADEVAALLLEAWPQDVAAPIAAQVHTVLSSAAGGGVVTVSSLFALYFASSGVESLRIGLNRAYETPETRNWLLLRLESIAYVLVGAVVLLALAFLILLGPRIYPAAARFAPGLALLTNSPASARYGIATFAIVAALVVAHKWLTAGRRPITEIAPGIIATVVLWAVFGAVFGKYIARFASSYVFYYAGLASVVTVLVFLYLVASVFVYGGELNAAIKRARASADPLEDPRSG
jgi:membrane protein